MGIKLLLGANTFVGVEKEHSTRRGRSRHRRLVLESVKRGMEQISLAQYAHPDQQGKGGG